MGRLGTMPRPSGISDGNWTLAAYKRMLHSVVTKPCTLRGRFEALKHMDSVDDEITQPPTYHLLTTAVAPALDLTAKMDDRQRVCCHPE